MKKAILVFIVSMFCADAFAQNFDNLKVNKTLAIPISSKGADKILKSDANGNATWVTPDTKIDILGILYDSTSWTNLSGFTNVGSPTTAISSNKITVSGGNQSISATVGTSNSAFNQVIKITSYGGTMLEKSRTTIKFKVNVSPGATTYGLAIGTYSINTFPNISNSMAYFNMSTGTGTGTVSLLAGTGNTTVAKSSTELTFSQNDYIVLSYQRIGDKIMATAYNQTTASSPVYCSYTYDPTSTSNVLMPNTSNFAIANLGGAYIVDSLNITSQCAKYTDVIFAGDSKLSGYLAGWDISIPNIFNKYYAGSYTSSGQSDCTQDMLNHVAEIIRLAPKTVILCIGRNDVALSISSATWQANIASIVSQLEATGITVRLLDAIYETSTNQAALVSYIQSTYPTKYIGTFSAGNATGSVATDGIHPSYIGGKIVSDLIYNSLKVTDNGKYLNNKGAGLPTNTGFENILVVGTSNLGTAVANTLATTLSITSGSGITATTNIQVGTTNYINWGGRSIMTSPSDGNILFRNSAGTDFSMQQFGGTTISYPGIARSSTNLVIALANATAGAGLGVGMASATGVAASAILEATSTSKGFLPPRMTKAQRDAISSPATGLVIWQTDNTPGIRSFNGTNWMKYTEATD